MNTFFLQLTLVGSAQSVAVDANSTFLFLPSVEDRSNHSHFHSFSTPASKCVLPIKHFLVFTSDANTEQGWHNGIILSVGSIFLTYFDTTVARVKIATNIVVCYITMTISLNPCELVHTIYISATINEIVFIAPVKGH